MGWAALLVGIGAGIIFGLSFGYSSPLPIDRIFAAIAWAVAGSMIMATLTSGAVNAWVISRVYGGQRLEGKIVTTEFSDSGFTRRSEHMESQFSWHAVDCVVEKNGLICIGMGPGTTFIPKRAFASESERFALLDWIMGQLDPVARDRSLALRRR